MSTKHHNLSHQKALIEMNAFCSQNQTLKHLKKGRVIKSTRKTNYLETNYPYHLMTLYWFINVLYKNMRSRYTPHNKPIHNVNIIHQIVQNTINIDNDQH